MSLILASYCFMQSMFLWYLFYYYFQYIVKHLKIFNRLKIKVNDIDFGYNVVKIVKINK